MGKISQNELVQQMTEYLLMNFGALDWWRLSKKWKRIKAEQVAASLVRETKAWVEYDG